MIRILGIDPGSRVTGWGVITLERGVAHHLAHGCIKAPEGALGERLRLIFDGVDAVIDRWQPTEMAVEKVFVNRNVDSALKLGQARGAAIVAGARHGLPLAEFTPAEIKKAIVGRGRAEKPQIQHMIGVLLGIDGDLATDAADALGVALCHGHTRDALARLPAAAGARRGWRR